MSAAEQATELESLRRIASAALGEFDATGVTDESPVKILEQALLCLDSDLDVVVDAASLGERTIEPMFFLRMQRRIRLALNLADHREKFGKLPILEFATQDEESAGGS